MYTHSASAFSINVPPGASQYSISETRIHLNNSDTITSVILIGCLPQSGDKYDMNTGKPCNHNFSATDDNVLFGCAPRSGDKYDMNTGKACVYDDKTVYLIGCAPRTGDIYNIYSGIPCASNIKQTETYKGTNGENKAQLLSSSPVSRLSTNINPSTISTEQSANPAETASGIDQKLSGREILKNGMAASVAKLGNITKGPMSGWLILLILVIILGGSYGIFSFNFFKNNNNEGEVEVKNKFNVNASPTAIKTETTTQSQPTQTPSITQGTMPLGSSAATSQSTNTIPQNPNINK